MRTGSQSAQPGFINQSPCTGHSNPPRTTPLPTDKCKTSVDGARLKALPRSTNKFLRSILQAVCTSLDQVSTHAPQSKTSHHRTSQQRHIAVPLFIYLIQSFTILYLLHELTLHTIVSLPFLFAPFSYTVRRHAMLRAL